MSFNAQVASNTEYGIMKVGSGLTATNGTISASLGLLNYGFFTNGNQLNPVANAINLVIFSHTGPSNGISIVNTTDITVVNAGTYSQVFTMNVNKTSAGASTISVWLKLNGVDVVDSTQDLILTGASDTIFVTGSFTLDIPAGGNIQLCWSSADTTMQLLALPGRVTPIRPSGSSVKVTLTRIS